MRKVNRNGVAEPNALSAIDSIGSKELERARSAKKRRPKAPVTFKAYKSEEVKLRLNQLFLGKCAYCEVFYSASSPMDVEHFRPKGAVSESPKHPGYWWLAMKWDNLLPSCIDCNRRRKQRVAKLSTSVDKLYDYTDISRTGVRVKSGKKDSFPIADESKRLKPEDHGHEKEGNLLLDPSKDDPRDHLKFHVSTQLPISLVLASGVSRLDRERGKASIEVYGLNRLGLVQDRTRLLRKLHFLGDVVVDVSTTIKELEGVRAVDATGQRVIVSAIKRLRSLRERVLQEIKELGKSSSPYSELVQSWIVEYSTRLLNPTAAVM